MTTVPSIEGYEKLRLLETAIEHSLNGVLVTDADLDEGPRILYVNRGFERITGYSRDDVLGKTPRMLQGPETSEEFRHELRAALEQGHSYDGETVNYTREGRRYVVSLHISPIYAADTGAVTHFVSVQRDETEDQERDDQLRLLSTALEVAGDPVLITDPQGNIVYVNVAFEEQTGYSRNQVLGQNPRLFKSGQQEDAFYQEMWETLKRGDAFRGEFVNRRHDGSLIHLEQTINPVINERGQITHFVAIGKDITDRVRMEDEVRRLAHTDWLTGLANRLSLGDTLETEMERSRRYGRPLSLIMFDIDHFKDFNDDYGHETGDEVLKKLADTVRKALREADALGRWGGEEFMIVVPETPCKGAATMAEKLRQTVAAMKTSCPISVTASFGVTDMRPGDTPKTFARRVDEAMYQAKEAGRNRVVSL
ncbi:GGDEF domain-containing protein [Thioalkalivibrio sp. ALJ1]|uniref:sensor domain-containing diguanylate cyclase n=1 Tax=Thioalkalivibrio sp. ALJ1 TaxID=1158144 RepID=UPI00056F8A52|nr:GGDEF domain-containing protein [Thioalkalivibrio sp. ALJ1]